MNSKIKLNIYAKNITSQHGEDGILEYILSALGDRIIRVALEAGAWDGVFASNVCHLWRDKSWRAILIEGDTSKFRTLFENTRGISVTVLNRRIEPAGENSLDRIFLENGIDPEIGILSLDIDSFDYHVWKGLRVVNPQIVVIEHNQNIPPHIEYHDPEGAVYLKCSAKALESLGTEKGYKLVCCTQTNSIFVRRDLFDPTKFPDMPVEWLFDYSELKPQIIFAGENGNMFPVFSKRARPAMKILMRAYYWLSALPKRRRHFVKPPGAVIAQLRNSGLDV